MPDPPRGTFLPMRREEELLCQSRLVLQRALSHAGSAQLHARHSLNCSSLKPSTQASLPSDRDGDGQAHGAPGPTSVPDRGINEDSEGQRLPEVTQVT